MSMSLMLLAGVVGASSTTEPNSRLVSQSWQHVTNQKTTTGVLAGCWLPLPLCVDCITHSMNVRFMSLFVTLTRFLAAASASHRGGCSTFPIIKRWPASTGDRQMQCVIYVYAVTGQVTVHRNLEDACMVS